MQFNEDFHGAYLAIKIDDYYLRTIHIMPVFTILFRQRSILRRASMPLSERKLKIAQFCVTIKKKRYNRSFYNELINLITNLS